MERIWLTFFKLAYYSGMCPFRFKRKSKEYILHSWWPQSIICAVLTLLSSVWIISEPRKLITDKKLGRSPNQFFILVYKLATAWLKLAAWKLMWFGGPSIQDIVNLLQSWKSSAGNGTGGRSIKRFFRTRNLLIIWTSVIVPVLFTLVILQKAVKGSGFGERRNFANWTAEWWWTRMVDSGRYIFLFNKRADNATLEVADRVLGAVALVAYIPRRLISFLCDWLLLISATSMWIVTNSFIAGLNDASHKESAFNTVRPKEMTSLNWSKVKAKFDELKYLASRVNAVLGTHFLLFLMGNLLEKGAKFDSYFVERGSENEWGNQLEQVFYLFQACIVMIIAADVSEKMTSFTEWLVREGCRRNIPADEIYLFIYQVDSHVVSIKGMNIFPINYSTLANILGTAVTYFIVCLLD